MASSSGLNLYSYNSVPNQGPYICWAHANDTKNVIQKKIEDHILNEDFQDLTFSIQLSPCSFAIKDVQIRWIISKTHLIGRVEKAVNLNGLIFVSHSGYLSEAVVTNYVQLLFSIFNSRGVISLEVCASPSPFQSAYTLFSNARISEEWIPYSSEADMQERIPSHQ